MTPEGTEALILAFTSKTGQSVVHIKRHRIFLFGFFCQREDIFGHFIGLRTSFHKGDFLGPEYLNNILGTNSHIKGTFIAKNFLVWGLLCIKSGWGSFIPVLPEVIN